MDHLHASVGHAGRNGLWFRSAVDAQVGVTITAVEIERPRAQGVYAASLHTRSVLGVDVRLTAYHCICVCPAWPFGLAANAEGVGFVATFCADTDGVANSFSIGERPVEGEMTRINVEFIWAKAVSDIDQTWA